MNYIYQIILFLWHQVCIEIDGYTDIHLVDYSVDPEAEYIYFYKLKIANAIHSITLQRLLSKEMTFISILFLLRIVIEVVQLQQ